MYTATAQTKPKPKPPLVDYMRPRKEMNIEEKLQEIINYYRATHKCGHTRAMLNGAKNSDCIILSREIHPKDLVGEFGDYTHNIYVARDVSDCSLRGHNKPLLIDHYDLTKLLQEAVDKIEELSRLESGAKLADDKFEGMVKKSYQEE